MIKENFESIHLDAMTLGGVCLILGAAVGYVGSSTYNYLNRDTDIAKHGKVDGIICDTHGNNCTMSVAPKQYGAFDAWCRPDPLVLHNGPPCNEPVTVTIDGKFFVGVLLNEDADVAVISLPGVEKEQVDRLGTPVLVMAPAGLPK